MCGGNWHPEPLPLPTINHPSETLARAARPKSAANPAISTQPQHHGRRPAPMGHGTNKADKGILTRNTHTLSTPCHNQTQRKSAQLSPEDTEPTVNQRTKPQKAAPDRAVTSSLTHEHSHRIQSNWTGLDDNSSWPPPAPRVGVEPARRPLVDGSPPVRRQERSRTLISAEHTLIVDDFPPRVGVEPASRPLVDGSPPVRRQERSGTLVSAEHTLIVDDFPLSDRSGSIID